MNGALRHVPPGRAGRLHLLRRLQTARRGADLLDQKLRILSTERQRFSLLTVRTGQAWQDGAREADSWLLRAVMLGGQRAVRLAQATGFADARITWALSMGVRYPSEAVCTAAEPDPSAPPVGNAALAQAADAYGKALRAAVEHAVAQTALTIMQAEEMSTRRRVRAIKNRRMPQLEQALAAVQASIGQQEHAEAVRLRWVMDRAVPPAHDNDGHTATAGPKSNERSRE